MSSDAHTIGALGKNAAGSKRLTRIKMDSLTFDALRIALLDSAARVRLEDQIPPSIARFVGMKIEGGFLKDQEVHFSNNLTCIIGGRGAGKSTMLESLRVASGNATENSRILDSEVWPDEISLLYEDEAGQLHTLTRRKQMEVINANPEGPTKIAIESYGQGETAETIQHCGDNPSILLKFLDDFIDFSDLKQIDINLCDALLDNQTRIEALLFDRNQIQEVTKAKAIADSQVATLKGQNASEIVALEEKLAKERRFRARLQTSLRDLLTSINQCLTSEELNELIARFDGSSLAVGKQELEAITQLTTSLAADVDSLSAQLKGKIKDATDKIGVQIRAWAAKEQVSQEKIEEIRRDLEKKNITLDMSFIRKVTKDATDLSEKLLSLNKSIPKLKEEYKQRRDLLNQRNDLRNRIYNLRQAFAAAMKENLAKTGVEYAVSIKFYEGLLSLDFEGHLKETMSWRTSQIPKAKIIAAQISPLALADAIDRNDNSELLGVVDDEGSPLLNQREAAEIMTTMGQWASKCKLERCAHEDRPEIKVTRLIQNPDGTIKPAIRDFSRLSLGQQQAILLTILLFSKRKIPLIIDQPEDNLDSEFIYKTLIRSLRSIKEHRQVIIVTHNANIAVLGDAELLIPLRGSSEYAIIRNRGSIDTAETKELVCTILEGSPKAFKRRQEVYGF